MLSIAAAWPYGYPARLSQGASLAVAGFRFLVWAVDGRGLACARVGLGQAGELKKPTGGIIVVGESRRIDDVGIRPVARAHAVSSGGRDLYLQACCLFSQQRTEEILRFDFAPV